MKDESLQQPSPMQDVDSITSGDTANIGNTAPPPTLLEQAKGVATRRLQVKEQQDQWEQMLADFRAEHAELTGGIADARTELQTLEEQLRDAVVATYIADPDKSTKVGPGLGIRNYQVTQYDKTEAIEWCQKNALYALTLDTKKFDSLVRAGGAPSSVATVEDRPAATIATDLGKALAE